MDTRMLQALGVVCSHETTDELERLRKENKELREFKDNVTRNNETFTSELQLVSYIVLLLEDEDIDTEDEFIEAWGEYDHCGEWCEDLNFKTKEELETRLRKIWNKYDYILQSNSRMVEVERLNDALMGFTKLHFKYQGQPKEVYEYLKGMNTILYEEDDGDLGSIFCLEYKKEFEILPYDEASELDQNDLGSIDWRIGRYLYILNTYNEWEEPISQDFKPKLVHKHTGKEIVMDWDECVALHKQVQELLFQKRRHNKYYSRTNTPLGDNTTTLQIGTSIIQHYTLGLNEHKVKYAEAITAHMNMVLNFQSENDDTGIIFNGVILNTQYWRFLQLEQFFEKIHESYKGGRGELQWSKVNGIWTHA